MAADGGERAEGPEPKPKRRRRRRRGSPTTLTKWRIGDRQVGRVFSEEHRRKLSEAKRGRKLPEAHREAISRGRTGQDLTFRGWEAKRDRQLAAHRERVERRYSLDLLRAHEAGRMDLYYDVWLSRGYRKNRRIFDSSVVSDGMEMSEVEKHHRIRRRWRPEDGGMLAYLSPEQAAAYLAGDLTADDIAVIIEIRKREKRRHMGLPPEEE